jgi:5-methyltetrahydropteroyltriglutamate--homocysteine methyltransferase
MRILLANHSSYPRVGDSKHSQRLRRAYASRERGEIDLAEFEKIERSVVAEVIREQEAAGLDLVTDGQVSWADPVSHLMTKLDGVRSNGLLRFLDTNFYLRQPVVEAKLRRRHPLITGEYRRAARLARSPVKVVLTGPYTLAHLSVLATTAYRSTAALAFDLAVHLAEEVSALVAAGTRFLQVDEPLILARPPDVRLLRELLEPLRDAAGDAAQLAIATYFGDAAPLYAQLNSLPADVLAVDCAESPALLDAIADTGSAKILALGLVDGRSTRLEEAAAVAAALERALRRYPHDTLFLQPSCGLEYLPRDRAAPKLGLLARVRELAGGADR